MTYSNKQVKLLHLLVGTGFALLLISLFLIQWQGLELIAILVGVPGLAISAARYSQLKKSETLVNQDLLNQGYTKEVKLQEPLSNRSKLIGVVFQNKKYFIRSTSDHYKVFHKDLDQSVTAYYFLFEKNPDLNFAVIHDRRQDLFGPGVRIFTKSESYQKISCETSV